MAVLQPHNYSVTPWKTRGLLFWLVWTVVLLLILHNGKVSTRRILPVLSCFSYMYLKSIGAKKKQKITYEEGNRWFNIMPKVIITRKYDHRCGWGHSVVASHAGPVFNPGRVTFLAEVCPGFFLNCKQMSGNVAHIRPRVLYGHHISYKPYSSVYGRRRSLTLVVVHGRC